MYLAVIFAPYNPRLAAAVQDYVGISVVLLSAVLMTVSSVYLYLAWSEFNLSYVIKLAAVANMQVF